MQQVQNDLQNRLNQAQEALKSSQSTQVPQVMGLNQLLYDMLQRLDAQDVKIQEQRLYMQQIKDRIEEVYSRCKN